MSPEEQVKQMMQGGNVAFAGAPIAASAPPAAPNRKSKWKTFLDAAQAGKVPERWFRKKARKGELSLYGPELGDIAESVYGVTEEGEQEAMIAAKAQRSVAQKLANRQAAEAAGLTRAPKQAKPALGSVEEEGEMRTKSARKLAQRQMDIEMGVTSTAAKQAKPKPGSEEEKDAMFASALRRKQQREIDAMVNPKAPKPPAVPPPKVPGPEGIGLGKMAGVAGASLAAASLVGLGAHALIGGGGEGGIESFAPGQGSGGGGSGGPSGGAVTYAMMALLGRVSGLQTRV